MLTNKGWNDIIGTIYDAYGNYKILLDTNGIGTLNPIRYRGYYYDVETGLYYLINRYYDPEIGRFISPNNFDSINLSEVNGLNLYLYGNNMHNSIKYRNTGTGMGGIVSTNGVSIISTTVGSSVLPALPGWTEQIVSVLDVFSSFAGVLEVSVWGFSRTGRLFSDFHYVAYGINRFALLDQLSSSLVNGCKVIGIGLIFADLGLNLYNSYQQGYSFAQGATSFALTAAKDIGVYIASSKVAGVVGSYIAGSKLGAALGSWAGPVGMIIGAIVGFAVGYIISEIGDKIIDWVDGLFD